MNSAVVFNAPDAADDKGNPAGIDPALVRAVDELVATADAQRWQEFGALACPETFASVGALIMQYTPQYDGSARCSTTPVSPARSPESPGPDSARFLAHEAFADVRGKYPQYFRDIDYTADDGAPRPGLENYVASRPTSWSRTADNGMRGRRNDL
ncbi:hypothetical protein [Nocardia sp. NBC_00403]|uniref:hypothetical protein n=1 Tax=Nocardia sp. NBC_00403 TaxID=2975990 RepID=UPI002E2434C0